MKLSLDYTWDCEPEAFWALYYDPDFTVRLHLDALGSTSAEVVSQEGDLTSGLVRTLRYGQRPNMPGPVRKIFGEEVVTTEVSTYDPATTTTTFTMTPGTMADKTQIDGRIALAREGDGATRDLLPRRPGQDLRGRADRRALHRAPGPRHAGEGGRLHAGRARGLNRPGAGRLVAVSPTRAVHATVHSCPLTGGPAITHCVGRHTFGRSPGTRTGT